MDFSANKRLIEIIKKGGFRGTYFRDTHSSINGRWYRKSWKEFDENVNKYIFKTGTSLRLWENKG